jgi:hypothetical protein
MIWLAWRTKRKCSNTGETVTQWPPHGGLQLAPSTDRPAYRSIVVRGIRCSMQDGTGARRNWV